MAIVCSPMFIDNLDFDVFIPVQKNFVQTVRAIELTLGISVPGLLFDYSTSSTNFTAALADTCSSPMFNDEVVAAITDAIPILLQIAFQYDIGGLFTSSPFQCKGKPPLVTK